MTFKLFMYIGTSPLGHLHSGDTKFGPQKNIHIYTSIGRTPVISVEGEMFSESQLGLTSIQGTRP